MAVSQAKIFNDPVHGHIEMHELCVKIIDTPEFQRLRNIKQLGGCYYVYPGAAHNRFEHSIGTAHLAGCLVESLKTKHPNKISDEDVLCVKIAGLCHDLGHGPFSHLFDGSFMKKATDGSWKHEKASLDMFDSIYEKLKDDFVKHKLQDKDAKFIKELIDRPTETKGSEDSSYKRRLKEKGFLYEIISNKESGIDVDKWDYFARDCLHLGMKSTFDHMRCIKMARVIEVKGRLHICFRDKEVHNFYEMFHTRALLHRRAYQHKTKNAVEHMITDALLEADTFLEFKGKDGKMLKMSEAIHDMEAYIQLTDEVYYQILRKEPKDTDPKKAEVVKARKILERIERRDLYRLIGDEHIVKEEIVGEDADKKIKLKKEILTEAKMDENMTDEDIILDEVKFDYGKKKEDPVTEVYFYRKKTPDEAFRYKKNEVSYMLPQVFIEWKIRLYTRKNLDEDERAKLEVGFEKWFQKKTEARKILERIERRDLYTLIGERTATKKIVGKDAEKEKKKKAILEEANMVEVKEEDIILDEVKYDYDKNEKDPVTEEYFYGKKESDEAFKFEENEIRKMRLYIRKDLNEDGRKELKKGFEKWFQKQTKAAGGIEVTKQDATPAKHSSTESLDGATGADDDAATTQDATPEKVSSTESRDGATARKLEFGRKT